MAGQKARLEGLIEEISSELGIPLERGEAEEGKIAYVREGEKWGIFLRYKKHKSERLKETITIRAELEVSLEGPGCDYGMVIKVPFRNIRKYIHLVNPKDREEVLKCKNNEVVYYRKNKRVDNLNGMKRQIYKLLGIEIEKW